MIAITPAAPKAPMPAPQTVYGGSLLLVPDEAVVVFADPISASDLAILLQHPLLGLMNLETGLAEEVASNDGSFGWAHVKGTSTQIDALRNEVNLRVRMVLPVYSTAGSAGSKRFAPTRTIFGFGTVPAPLPPGWAQVAAPPFVAGMYALRGSSNQASHWFGVEGDLRGTGHTLALDWLQLHSPYPTAVGGTGVPSTPDDPGFGPPQWSIAHIGVPKIWPHQIGSALIKVAVIDSGLDMAAADLQPSLVVGDALKVAVSLASDEVVTTLGVNATIAHGTFTAGVISASVNNSIGVAGIAPKCPFFPIQIGDHAWRVGDHVQVKLAGSELVIALAHARACGARVAHLGVDLDLASKHLYELNDMALESAWEDDLCMVAPAGNDGGYSEIAFPARNPHVIAVGASLRPFSGAQEDAWSQSQSGPGLLLVAPGEGIVTTDVNNGVNDDFNATSSAAPHVTGTVALMLSQNPELSLADVVCILASTADKVPNTLGRYLASGAYGPYDARMGYGRLNAAAAWKMAAESEQGGCQPVDINAPHIPVNPQPRPRPKSAPKPTPIGGCPEMDKVDFCGGGIASPMLVLLAGYVAGLEKCCGPQSTGGSGSSSGSSGGFPAPTVAPRPDAINGAIWHDLNANWQNDDGTGAYMGTAPKSVLVRLVGPMVAGQDPPLQQDDTNSEGVYDFGQLQAGVYKLVVPRNASGVNGAAVQLVMGTEEIIFVHIPGQYHRQDYAYR